MKVTVKKGESLYEALQKMNIVMERPCGGNGTCGLCAVEVERFGKVKSCQFRIPGTYEVTMPERAAFDIVSAKKRDVAEKEISLKVDKNDQHPVTGWDETPKIAIDIGTTTVAWRIFYQGNEYSGGFVNPQRQFGADVMSRIQQANDGNLKKLQEVLVNSLYQELGTALSYLSDGKLDSEGECTLNVVIAANTTMLHLLNGWSCEGLGRAPFQPISLELLQAEQTYGKWKVHVTELPGISAFIGADIVSGIYSAQLLKTNEPMLLLDLGTNGEMAIAADGKILTASTAAGPAFEASELALKIHASGVLHVLHEMLTNGAMDETGLLSDEYFESGYPVEGTVMTQDLIRQLQMAKGAIRAGIEILLTESGISASEVRKIYLAGGMGYYIRPEDAIAIGLLPEEFHGKIIATGNSSLAGAEKFLKRGSGSVERLGDDEMIQREQKELTHIIACATELLLSNHPEFDELYIRYMSF